MKVWRVGNWCIKNKTFEQSIEVFEILRFSNTKRSFVNLLNNHMSVKTNRYNYYETFEEAKLLLSQCAFKDCEPGPCRIFAVYSVPDC